MLYAVIMSGGSGTRFWPRSRTAAPKQLLPLFDGRSLLQETLARILPEVPADRVLVITNRAQEKETRAQLPELPADNIVIEPTGRDTAPCIGLAAAILQARDPNAILAVLPADHRIEPAEAFRETLARAAALVEPGQVITLGAPPNRPATGFGYIQAGEEMDERLYRVERFKEKPDLATARRYLEASVYLWNCGIFIWHARTVLDELGRRDLSIHRRVLRIAEAWGTEDQEAVLEREYAAMERISIDYAVLERCADIAVIAIDFAWDDLGSWTAVERLYPSDENGNRSLDARHLAIDSVNTFVVGEGPLVATIGVENLIVVQTPDALLICRRDRAEDVKLLVKRLEAEGRSDLLE